MWSWRNPTEVRFGEGLFRGLKKVVEPFDRILVLTGPTFVKKSGLINVIEEQLKGKEWHWYDEVLPEPTWDVVQRAVDFARDYKPRCVVGVGGGSVLDTSKLVASFVDKPFGVRDFIGKRVELERSVFSVCVPTTSGSGSEVTPYCVVMDREREIKAPVTSSANYPDVALDDPVLTRGAPFEVTRNAGVDALSHCLEAYLSRRANPVTELFSVDGMRLVFKYLKNALRDEPVARRKMMLASLYGGFAISNAGAGLIHQLGHALTVLKGLSHGYTMGIFMVPVLELYGDAVRERLSRLERALGIKYFLGFLNRFLKELGIPGFNELSLSEEEKRKLVKIVMKREHVLKLLPATVDEYQLLKFLEEYEG